MLLRTRKCVDQITWSVCSCNGRSLCFLPNESPSDHASVLDSVDEPIPWESSLEDSRCSYLPYPLTHGLRLETVVTHLKINRTFCEVQFSCRNVLFISELLSVYTT